ncbi:hypothetical protein ACOMHN_047575 [Nucella lapillus]
MHRTPSDGQIEAHEQALSLSLAKLAVQRQAVTQAELRSQHRLQAQVPGHGKSGDVGQTRTLGVDPTQSEAEDADDDLDSTDTDDQFDFNLTVKGSSMPLSSLTRARAQNRTTKGSSLQVTTAQVKDTSSRGQSMWYVQQSQTSSISNVPSGSTTARRLSIYIPTCPPEEGSMGTPEESHRCVDSTGAAPGGEEDARQAVSPAFPDPPPPTPEGQDDQDVYNIVEHTASGFVPFRRYGLITKRYGSDNSRSRSDINRSRSDINRSRSDNSRSRSDINRSRSDINRSRSDNNRSSSDINRSRSDNNRSCSDINRNQLDFNWFRFDFNQFRRDIIQFRPQFLPPIDELVRFIPPWVFTSGKDSGEKEGEDGELN